MTDQLNVAHYFVDEAGDTTLFNRRGKVIVGSEGVSYLFMVGVAHLPNPRQVEESLTQLRAELLADPFFKGVPSMQPEQKKTALCFHAKDDLPEVRREVFKLLPTFGATIQIAIRRKAELADAAKMLHKLGHRYRPDEIYDDLIRHVFKNLLDQADDNRICFARRGKSSREHALRLALAKARTGLDQIQIAALPKEGKPSPRKKRDFESKYGFPPDDSTIVAAYPHESAGLQVIDYYLWALHRMWERGEERFFASLADGYKLVMDLDDKRNSGNGEWYSESNPLSLEKITPVAG
jgi:hypothetical protein